MKRGFSLIELVFAVVIIGISVSVLPRIILQSQRSNEFSLNQELIFQAKSMMVRVIQGAWDSSHVLRRCQIIDPACVVGTILFNNVDISPVPIYNVAMPTGNANERVGIITTGVAQHNRNLFDRGDFNATPKANFNAISFGKGIRNDIDDYDGVAFTTATTDSSGDFLFNTNIAVAVDYMDQNWAIGNHRNEQAVTINLNAISAVPTNIKRVTITATNTEAVAQPISLVGYFSNIGQASFNRRAW